MPLKLNVGLSRKVGEPQYSSRGASVNVELELDATVVGDPERLRERIRFLFGLARSSVDEQLEGGDPPSEHGNPRQPGAGAHSGNGNGADRAATDSQIRAIHAIARRQQVGLPALLRERFGVERPDALSLRDASALIDSLKGQEARASR